MSDFEESYKLKINDSKSFKEDVSKYLKKSVSYSDGSSYVYLLSAIFEPVVLNGYSKTSIANSSSVCDWLDNYKNDFRFIPESRKLFQKVRNARNGIVHININYECSLQSLRRYVYSMPYPIFKQCMEDLLQDFKSLYDMQSIYLKLGGNKDTIPDDDDDELPQIE